MPTAALLVSARTVTLSAPDERGVAVSLCELQPRGALSPGEGNPTRHTQPSCTALPAALPQRYPICAQQQTRPCCDIHSD